MKEKLKNFWLKMALTGLCTGAIMFGLTTGSVLAQWFSFSYRILITGRTTIRVATPM
jgi:hypothetical protein